LLSGRDPLLIWQCFFPFSLLFLSFSSNKVLLLFCNLCLCPVLCSGDTGLGVFWTSVFLDYSAG
jgi:hypothetical protein